MYRVCTIDGCSTLIRTGTRCEAHQRKEPTPPVNPVYRSQQTRTHTRRRGGYDRTWMRIVAAAIKEQPWCSWPGCYATEDLTGDHIVPLSKGGTNTRENCRVLCRHHNSARGNRDAA